MSDLHDRKNMFLESRIGRIALAAVGWSVIGCIFALPNINMANGWRMPLFRVAGALVVLGSARSFNRCR